MMKKKEGATKNTQIELKIKPYISLACVSVSVYLCFKIICQCFSFSDNDPQSAKTSNLPNACIHALTQHTTQQ